MESTDKGAHSQYFTTKLNSERKNLGIFENNAKFEVLVHKSVVFQVVTPLS
jgi:hypothetical protein